MDPEQFAAAVQGEAGASPLPRSMAGRVQAVCRIVVDEYGGKAAALWSKLPDGEALIERLTALPGFGEQKARIFAALLGKQLGVQPEGWRAATAPFGEAGSYLSVADITDAESLDKVRAHKQAMKAKARRAPKRDALPARRPS